MLERTKFKELNNKITVYKKYNLMVSIFFSILPKYIFKIQPFVNKVTKNIEHDPDTVKGIV